MTENQKQGEELNQLARLLFNKAATNWYSGILIEITAGILAVTVALLKLSDSWNTFMALISFVLLLIAYVLRKRFNDFYSTAETMRRQAALSEAVDWAINKIQFSAWRQIAGKKLMNKFQIESRPADYYATKENIGPKRLLEMTAESAFWTRHLYLKLKVYLWVIFGLAVGLFIVAISLSPVGVVSSSVQLKITYAVYLLLPLVLTIDLFGWANKLNEVAKSIYDIECNLESLETDPKIEGVLRLVSEYNCHVVSGFPIPNWFFKYHHDEIDSMWKHHKRIC